MMHGATPRRLGPGPRAQGLMLASRARHCSTAGWRPASMMSSPLRARLHPWRDFSARRWCGAGRRDRPAGQRLAQRTVSGDGRRRPGALGARLPPRWLPPNVCGHGPKCAWRRVGQAQLLAVPPLRRGDPIPRIDWRRSAVRARCRTAGSSARPNGRRRRPSVCGATPVDALRCVARRSRSRERRLLLLALPAAARGERVTMTTRSGISGRVG